MSRLRRLEAVYQRHGYKPSLYQITSDMAYTLAVVQRHRAMLSSCRTRARRAGTSQHLPPQ